MALDLAKAQQVHDAMLNIDRNSLSPDRQQKYDQMLNVLRTQLGTKPELGAAPRQAGDVKTQLAARRGKATIAPDGYGPSGFWENAVANPTGIHPTEIAKGVGDLATGLVKQNPISMGLSTPNPFDSGHSIANSIDTRLPTGGALQALSAGPSPTDSADQVAGAVKIKLNRNDAIGALHEGTAAIPLVGGIVHDATEPSMAYFHDNRAPSPAENEAANRAEGQTLGLLALSANGGGSKRAAAARATEDALPSRRPMSPHGVEAVNPDFSQVPSLPTSIRSRLMNSSLASGLPENEVLIKNARRMGKNPGLVLNEEFPSLPRGEKQGPLADARLQEIHNATKQVLSQAPEIAGRRLAEPTVLKALTDPIRAAAEEHNQIDINEGGEHQIDVNKHIANVESALRNQLVDQFGTTTPTVDQLNDLKADLYSKVNKFKQVQIGDQSAQGVRQMQAHNLMQLIESATTMPGGKSPVADLNYRYGSLATARDAIENQQLARETKSPFLSRVMFGSAAGGAAGAGLGSMIGHTAEGAALGALTGGLGNEVRSAMTSPRLTSPVARVLRTIQPKAEVAGMRRPPSSVPFELVDRGGNSATRTSNTGGLSSAGDAGNGVRGAGRGPAGGEEGAITVPNDFPNFSRGQRPQQPPSTVTLDVQPTPQRLPLNRQIGDGGGPPSIGDITPQPQAPPPPAGLPARRPAAGLLPPASRITEKTAELSARQSAVDTEAARQRNVRGFAGIGVRPADVPSNQLSGGVTDFGNTDRPNPPPAADRLNLVRGKIAKGKVTDNSFSGKPGSNPPKPSRATTAPPQPLKVVLPEEEKTSPAAFKPANSTDTSVDPSKKLADLRAKVKAVKAARKPVKPPTDKSVVMDRINGTKAVESAQAAETDSSDSASVPQTAAVTPDTPVGSIPHDQLPPDSPAAQLAGTVTPAERAAEAVAKKRAEYAKENEKLGLTTPEPKPETAPAPAPAATNKAAEPTPASIAAEDASRKSFRQQVADAEDAVGMATTKKQKAAAQARLDAIKGKRDELTGTRAVSPTTQAILDEKSAKASGNLVDITNVNDLPTLKKILDGTPKHMVMRVKSLQSKIKRLEGSGAGAGAGTAATPLPARRPVASSSPTPTPSDEVTLPSGAKTTQEALTGQKAATPHGEGNITHTFTNKRTGEPVHRVEVEQPDGTIKSTVVAASTGTSGSSPIDAHKVGDKVEFVSGKGTTVKGKVAEKSSNNGVDEIVVQDATNRLWTITGDRIAGLKKSQ